jgi:pre-mRNA-processing factor 8
LPTRGGIGCFRGCCIRNSVPLLACKERDRLFQAGLRAIPRELRAVPRELRAIPRELRAVPRGLRAIPRELRAIPRELRAIPRELRAVPRGLRAIPRELRAVPPATQKPSRMSQKPSRFCSHRLLQRFLYREKCTAFCPPAGSKGSCIRCGVRLFALEAGWGQTSRPLLNSYQVKPQPNSPVAAKCYRPVMRCLLHHQSTHCFLALSK